jgi:hypothetical protein
MIKYKDSVHFWLYFQIYLLPVAVLPALLAVQRTGAHTTGRGEWGHINHGSFLVVSVKITKSLLLFLKRL